MASLEDRLLTDISWRQDELAILKTSYAQAPETNPRGRALRRAYVALLYAHYEGFSKVAWEEHLIEISRCGLPLNQLRSGLVAIFTRPEINVVKNCSISDFRDEIFKFRARLLDTVSPPYEKMETSNLWPVVFEEVMKRLELDSTFIQPHAAQLKSLVARRNDIAHGDDVGVSDQAIAVLDAAVWEVFLNLTICVVNSHEKKLFRT